MKYERTCPKCKVTIYYFNKYSLKYAEINESFCRKCKYTYIRGNIDNFVIIRGEKFYIKNCPQCYSVMRYKKWNRRNESIKKNRICQTCANKNMQSPEGNFTILNDVIKYIRNCPLCNKELLYVERSHRNKAEKRKQKCYSCANSINISKKIREKTFFSRYNPKACDFMDKWGKINGYNFQHALNGGEYFISKLGYWVDGYDKEKNVVFEYDEKQHYTSENLLLEDDRNRMDKIIRNLSCKFFRYNELTKEIKQY